MHTRRLLFWGTLVSAFVTGIIFVTCSQRQIPAPVKVTSESPNAGHERGGRLDTQGVGGGGIGSLAHDPANLMPAEWPPNADKHLKELAGAGVDLVTEFDSGKAKWFGTLLSLSSPNFQHQERRRCAEAFGAELTGTCKFDIKMAVRRTGPSEGQIAYVQAHTEQATGGDCEQFVGCLIKQRVGLTIPLPAGEEDLLGFGQKVMTKPPDERMKDPAHLRSSINILSEDLARAKEMGLFESDDAKMTYSVKMQEEFVKYMQDRLTEVEG